MSQKEIVLGRIPKHIRESKPDSNWIPKARIDNKAWGTNLIKEENYGWKRKEKN